MTTNFMAYAKTDGGLRHFTETETSERTLCKVKVYRLITRFDTGDPVPLTDAWLADSLWNCRRCLKELEHPTRSTS